MSINDSVNASPGRVRPVNAHILLNVGHPLFSGCSYRSIDGVPFSECLVSRLLTLKRPFVS